MLLDQKVVLITGGTGGLGKAVTKVFLNSGAQVVISYIIDDELEKLNLSLGDKSQVDGIKADLTHENSVKILFEEIFQKYGQLDILIHLVGGFWMGGNIAETPFEKWEQMMRINLTTNFLCTREAFALMQNQGSGKLFTISARTALELPGGMGAYSVSKAAVLALTEILSKEGKAHNIQVNTLIPSVIDTEANRCGMPDADFDEWVKPKEIANVLLSLSMPGNIVSGSAIKVYGRA